MTADEWANYLRTLPPELAEFGRRLIERCSSVIAEEQLRHLDSEDVEQAARIAGDQALRSTANSDHMLIQDQEARIKTIEGEDHAKGQ